VALTAIAAVIAAVTAVVVAEILTKGSKNTALLVTSQTG